MVDVSREIPQQENLNTQETAASDPDKRTTRGWRKAVARAALILATLVPISAAASGCSGEKVSPALFGDDKANEQVAEAANPLTGFTESQIAAITSFEERYPGTEEVDIRDDTAFRTDLRRHLPEGASAADVPTFFNAVADLNGIQGDEEAINTFLDLEGGAGNERIVVPTAEEPKR